MTGATFALYTFANGVARADSEPLPQEFGRQYFSLGIDVGRIVSTVPRETLFGVDASYTPYVGPGLLRFGVYVNPSVGVIESHAKRTPRLSAGAVVGYSLLGVDAGPAYDLKHEWWGAQGRIFLSLLVLRNSPEYDASCCPPDRRFGQRCACRYDPQGLLVLPYVSTLTDFADAWPVTIGVLIKFGWAL